MNRTQSNELGNAMGRFAVGAALVLHWAHSAGGVYVFGGQFLWLFTGIALIGVLLYVMPLLASTDTDATGEGKKLCLNLLILVPTTGSFGKLFFVIASRSILFSVLSILSLFCILQLSTEKPVHRVWPLMMYFAMGAVLTYMGGALSDKLGFLKQCAR